MQRTSLPVPRPRCREPFGEARRAPDAVRQPRFIDEQHVVDDLVRDAAHDGGDPRVLSGRGHKRRVQRSDPRRALPIRRA